MQDLPSTVETRPLHFFRAQSPLVRFGRNLRIRAVTKTEKYPPEEDELGGWGAGLGWGLERGYAALSFVVDCLGPSDLESTSEIERLATCLLMYKTDLDLSNRLPKFELSYYGLSASEWSGQLPVLNDADLERIDLLTPTGPFVLYMLDLAEQDSFVKFWAEMTKKGWPPNVMGAARRLLRAQHRVGQEEDDKLIDLLIALEALVVRKKELPKGKNLSQRAGKLQRLKGHLEQRAIEELSIAYDLRNDAVHDGFFSQNNLTKVGGASFIWSYITHIEQYVRVGMRYNIEMTNQGLSKDDVIQQLS